MGNFQSHPPPKCKEWNVRRSFGPGLVNRIKGSLLKQLSSAQNNFSLIIVSGWNIKEITPSSCGHKSELKGATFRCKLNLITLSHYLFADFTAGLRLTEVRIPNHVVRDSTARLECHYDLDGEALYSVKWYRDGLEFYRYVPRDMPPAFIYDQSGLTIDVSNTRLNGPLLFVIRCRCLIHWFLVFLPPILQLHNSTDTQVVLTNVTLKATGRYRCEVSAEAPSFQTVSDHGDMIVVGELTILPLPLRPGIKILKHPRK